MHPNHGEAFRSAVPPPGAFSGAPRPSVVSLEPSPRDRALELERLVGVLVVVAIAIAAVAVLVWLTTDRHPAPH